MSDRTMAYVDMREAPHETDLGKSFQRRFQAGDRVTRSILEEMVQELTDTGVGAEDVSNLELVLAEVLNNIAEHAYAGTSGPVDLRVEVTSEGMLCRISDQGRPLPAGVVPDPALPLIAPPDHLPEGGFGWHIIRCLALDLGYAQESGWNRLSLRLPLVD